MVQSPSSSATQKPQQAAPPPDPKPAEAKPADPKPVDQKPAEQKPADQQAQAPAQQPAPKDGFEAQAKAPEATQRDQGDTFDQKSGGGLGDTLLNAAKTVAAPVVNALKPVVDAVAPVVAPVVNAVAPAAAAIGGAIGGAIGQFAGHMEDLWGNKAVISKLADIGQPGVLQDAVNPPPADKPTEGMTADQQKAYDALPPDQKTRYDELHAQASDTWRYRTVGPQATIATPSSSVDNLRKLLTSGKFGEYTQVEDALKKDPTQASRVSDMRDLLYTGKLTDGQVNRDFQGTLDSMAQLAKGGTTDTGVDRTQLLGQIARDLSHPEQIRQGTGNKDCGGTTAAFVMALTQPAEYSRMMQGLGEKGQVELTPEWAKWFGAKSNVMKVNGQFDPNDKSRSVTQQLFAKTFDQEAVNNQQPVTAPGQAQQAATQGVTGDQLKSGLNDKGILGGGWDAVYMPPADEPGKPPAATEQQRADAAKAAEAMIDGAKPRQPVMVNVNNHWMAVLGKDREGNIWVKDPQTGAVSQKTMKDLTTGLNAVVYQPGNQKNQPPDFMHNAAWAEPGGGGPNGGGLGGGGGSGGTSGR
ncbi:MAG TPA: hypothetical protein VFA20_31505 [Myxococcaceae bacterium]|nr:hypothetical protein [Myxococcaceae bacterium]